MKWKNDALIVGIDWGREEHAVCVLTAEGDRVCEWTVEHSGRTLAELADRLNELAGGDPNRVHVAIELKRGALVETLMEREFHVYSVNPKQSDRFRDRYFPAGSKDDRRDAFVVADALRTDLHCFRLLRPEDPTTIELREHVRMHDELREDENRTTNRLRDQVLRHFPQLVKLNPNVGDAWMLDLVEKAPTPALARKELTRETLSALLKKHHVRKYTVDHILDMLEEPDVHVAPGTAEAAAAHIVLLVPTLRLVHSHQRIVTRKLEAILESLSAPESEAKESSPEKVEHRDAEVLLSLPGVGTYVAATMLAEASLAIRDRDYAALRAHSGVAPITKKSGKKKRGPGTVSMRRACDDRLNDAMYHFARVAAQRDETAKAQYVRLRRSGHTHGRALRGVGDRLLAVAVAMLKTGTLYDASRRQATVAVDPKAA